MQEGTMGQGEKESTIEPKEWAAITQLITDAMNSEELRSKLRHGPQADIITLLDQEKYNNLKPDRLRQIHGELENIWFKGSLPFWWW
jgi:hypothetical protein